MFAFVLLVGALCLSAAERRPSGQLSLPQADGVIQSTLSEQVQWWYYTGFLRLNGTSATSPPDYGFEICAFLVENDMQMVQVRETLYICVCVGERETYTHACMDTRESITLRL